MSVTIKTAQMTQVIQAPSTVVVEMPIADAFLLYYLLHESNVCYETYADLGSKLELPVGSHEMPRCTMPYDTRLAIEKEVQAFIEKNTTID